MQKWEYKRVILDYHNLEEWMWSDTGKSIEQEPQEERLNELGRYGWELVSMSSFVSDGQTTGYAFYFKRPA
ncbi:MAG TPA: DUF4177 domain-containing protein [Anaerolineales bacterium]|nr:DUF4177 domain-containing protein [Anaerolineales bacterium]